MTQQPQTYPKPAWLENARFYEVYPQSFADSNGDGIGDIPGITGKLDYIAALGCNALWINPCFDSPFKDAGYDVRDYTQVAPRYGTNDDLIALFEAAHRRGMHVLLDLVPGHTSEEHPWFQASSRPNPAERTIVASSDGPSRKENTGDPTTAPSEEGLSAKPTGGETSPPMSPTATSGPTPGSPAATVCPSSAARLSETAPTSSTSSNASRPSITVSHTRTRHGRNRRSARMPWPRATR